MTVTARQRRIAARVARRYAGLIDDVPSLSPADLCQSGLLQLCTWLSEHPGEIPSPQLVWFIAKSGVFRAIKAAAPRRRPGAKVYGWSDVDDARPSPQPDGAAVLDVGSAVASLTPARRSAVEDWLDGRNVAESAARSGPGVPCRRRRAFAALRTTLAAYDTEDQ